MNRYKYQLIILVLFLSNVLLNGQSNNSKNENQESKLVWKTLTGDSYEIMYPSTWIVDQSGQMGTSFFLFSPLSDESDTFKENANLIIQDLSSYDLNLDQFVDASLNQIKSFIADYNIISNERISTDDTEYQKILYTGKQGIAILRFEQFYWLIDNKAYVLTMTFNNLEYDNYKETSDKIMNSFKLL